MKRVLCSANHMCKVYISSGRCGEQCPLDEQMTISYSREHDIRSI